SGAYIREDRCQTPIEDLRTVALRPPIDLLYIAAAMELSECLCQIIDYPLENKSWDDLKEDIENISPDILVISATTPSLSKDMMAGKDKILTGGIVRRATATGGHSPRVDTQPQINRLRRTHQRARP
ncbi:hypothetical protein, partial [Methylovulum sp.]|uniref:hypothetical protein n=1 Tax=Methylovulum sp. TaxID=1916980 RepID=UPI00261C227B